MKSFTFYILALIFFAGCSGIDSDIHPKKGTTSQSAKEAFEWGKYWYQNKDFDRALSKFDDALLEDPDYVDAMISYANTLREIGNSIFIKNPKAAKDNHEAAYNWLLKAQLLDKDNLEIKYSLGLLFFQRANIPEKVFSEEERKSYRDLSIRYFQEVLKAKPDDFQANRYLGIALLEKSDVAGAKEHLQFYFNYAQAELTRWQNTVAKTGQDDITKFQQMNYWGKEVDEIGGLLKDIEKPNIEPSNH